MSPKTAKPKTKSAATAATESPPPAEVVTSIKGFDADFRCYGGFQFQVGETYKATGEIVACQNGFHAIEGNPFEVWSYRGPTDDDGRLSRYGIVDQSGDLARRSEDSKIASGILTVKVEIGLGDFIARAISWIVDATKVVVKGADSALNDNGRDATKIGASGNSTQIGASGNSTQIGASGDSTKIGASGNYTKIGASGNYTKIVTKGSNAVVASAGVNTTFSGAIGAWVSLAEFDNRGKCLGFATGCIGEGGLKPNVSYRAKGGKLVEVEL